ncbi:hypothetical protein LWI28_000736 [Acer negundo]|uniref:Uncharacterized protein n=1 Tax=Acer negundo TaxID=4023 RepID=A0AAD5IWQ7_ACENE|nr:hypothetical protein LWI28_000736 [Acer negundo]
MTHVYRYMDSQPNQRNQVPYPQYYYPSYDGVPPHMMAVDQVKFPAMYESWPYGSNCAYPMPCHTCGSHGNFPSYYSFQPPLPHFFHHRNITDVDIILYSPFKTLSIIPFLHIIGWSYPEEPPYSFKFFPVKPPQSDDGKNISETNKESLGGQVKSSKMKENSAYQKSILVKQVGMNKEDKAENTSIGNSSGTSMKRQFSSPPKMSKLPPVCLRIEPLPRKKNGLKENSPLGAQARYVFLIKSGEVKLEKSEEKKSGENSSNAEVVSNMQLNGSFNVLPELEQFVNLPSISEEKTSSKEFMNALLQGLSCDPDGEVDENKVATKSDGTDKSTELQQKMIVDEEPAVSELEKNELVAKE